MTFSLETAFEQVIANTIGASLPIAILCLVRWWRPSWVSPAWGAILAGAIFVRLALPVTPAIGWDPVRLLPETLIPSITTAPVPERSEPFSPIVQALPRDVFSSTRVDPFSIELSPTPDPWIAVEREAAQAPETIEATSPQWAFDSLLAMLWLAVAAILAGGTLFQQWRFRQRVRRHSLPASAREEEILSECRRRLGIRKSVRLRRLPGSETAVLFGVFRPVVLLPDGSAQARDDSELRVLLLHELSHLRRHDLTWNWITQLVLFLHWFNPLAWWLARRFRIDREVLCDHRAAAALGDSRRYAETLLRFATAPERRAAPVLAHPTAWVSFHSRYTELKHRLLMIRKTTPFTLLPQVTLLSVLLLAGWLSLPASGDEKDPAPKRDAPEREEAADRPRGDSPEREARRGDGDRDEEAREVRGRPDRDRPERERGDGDDPGRPHPERDQPMRDQPEREARRDGDREEPGRVVRRDGDRPMPGRPDGEHRDPRHMEMEQLHRELREAHESRNPERARMIEHRIKELAHAVERRHGAHEAEIRIRHLRMAAENLERAGLHDEAREYAEKAEWFEREMREEHGGHEGHHQREQFEREIHELHEIIGDLRREVERLRDELHEARGR